MGYGIKPLPIKGFENYFVTKDGRVFNTIDSKQNILNNPIEIKTHINKVTGYRQTTLQNKGTGMKPKTFYVHRLVALTYIKIPSVKHTQVNHKNFDKADNRILNLEWVTPQQNRKHSDRVNSNLGLKAQLKINDRLLRAGIKVYSITQSLNDVADVWDCSEGYAANLLKENGIELIGKAKLPHILRDELIEAIKNQILSQRKIGLKIVYTKEFITYIEAKYDTTFDRRYLDKLKVIALDRINNTIQKPNFIII